MLKTLGVLVWPSYLLCLRSMPWTSYGLVMALRISDPGGVHTCLNPSQLWSCQHQILHVRWNWLYATCNWEYKEDLGTFGKPMFRPRPHVSGLPPALI